MQIKQKGYQLEYNKGVYTLYNNGNFIAQSIDIDEVLSYYKDTNENIITQKAEVV